MKHNKKDIDKERILELEIKVRKLEEENAKIKDQNANFAKELAGLRSYD